MISVVQVRHVQGRLPNYGEEARVVKSPELYPAKVLPHVVPHDQRAHRPQHQQQQQPVSPQVPRSRVRKAQTPKVDPLSDELRWDLLRELFKEVCALIHTQHLRHPQLFPLHNVCHPGGHPAAPSVISYAERNPQLTRNFEQELGFDSHGGVADDFTRTRSVPLPASEVSEHSWRLTDGQAQSSRALRAGDDGRPPTSSSKGGWLERAEGDLSMDSTLPLTESRSEAATTFASGDGSSTRRESSSTCWMSAKTHDSSSKSLFDIPPWPPAGATSPAGKSNVVAQKPVDTVEESRKEPTRFSVFAHRPTPTPAAAATPALPCSPFEFPLRLERAVSSSSCPDTSRLPSATSIFCRDVLQEAGGFSLSIDGLQADWDEEETVSLGGDGGASIDDSLNFFDIDEPSNDGYEQHQAHLGPGVASPVRLSSNLGTAGAARPGLFEPDCQVTRDVSWMRKRSFKGFGSA